MTWSVWRVAPVVTSIFFILGVFTLYVVLVDWLKSKIRLKYPEVREHTIESWFGVIYILVFVYSLQLGIAGQDISWLFMNFQLIAVIFCAYFLAIHIPFKAFFADCCIIYVDQFITFVLGVLDVFTSNYSLLLEHELRLQMVSKTQLCLFSLLYDGDVLRDDIVVPS